MEYVANRTSWELSPDRTLTMRPTMEGATSGALGIWGI